MSADDFDLPPALEATLKRVCAERGVPLRRLDELRSMLREPPANWPRCCGAQCQPCVDEQAEIARAVLEQHAVERDADG